MGGNCFCRLLVLQGVTEAYRATPPPWGVVRAWRIRFLAIWRVCRPWHLSHRFRRWCGSWMGFLQSMQRGRRSSAGLGPGFRGREASSWQQRAQTTAVQWGSLSSTKVPHREQVRPSGFWIMCCRMERSSGGTGDSPWRVHRGRCRRYSEARGRRGWSCRRHRRL